MPGARFRVSSQIAKTIGSMSIIYRSDAKVPDRDLLNVDTRVFAIGNGDSLNPTNSLNQSSDYTIAILQFSNTGDYDTNFRTFAI